MNLHNNAEDTKLELQIAPLIDVVFLLLIYFMVTAALIKKEGDISFMLPTGSIAPPSNLPVEAQIEIGDDHIVRIEGLQYNSADRMLVGLEQYVRGLRELATLQQSPFFVNILPDKDTLHWRIIDVMDACAAAGVTNLSFSKSM